MSNYGTYWKTLRKLYHSEFLIIKWIIEMALLLYKFFLCWILEFGNESKGWTKTTLVAP